jgi:hypothetical protein
LPVSVSDFLRQETPADGTRRPHEKRGKTTDEIAYMWNSAHPADMILFAAEPERQPFQAAGLTVSQPE